MNIYLISREHATYGDYESAVVIAQNEESARNIYPGEDYEDPGKVVIMDWNNAKSYTGWVEKKEDVKVYFLGVARPLEDKERIVCSSYIGG